MKYLFLFLISFFFLPSVAHVHDSIPRMNLLTSKNTLSISASMSFALAMESGNKSIGLAFFAGQYGVAAEYFPFSRFSVRGGYFLGNTLSREVTPGYGKNINNFFGDLHYYPKFIHGYVYASIGTAYSFGKIHDQILNSYTNKTLVTTFFGAGVNFPVDRIFRKANSNLFFEYLTTIPFQIFKAGKETSLSNPSTSCGGFGIKYVIPGKR